LCFTMCFTICSCISPDLDGNRGTTKMCPERPVLVCSDLDGYRAPKMKHRPHTCLLRHFWRASKPVQISPFDCPSLRKDRAKSRPKYRSTTSRAPAPCPHRISQHQAHVLHPAGCLSLRPGARQATAPHIQAPRRGCDLEDAYITVSRVTPRAV
jgi:hypothetical protein